MSNIDETLLNTHVVREWLQKLYEQQDEAIRSQYERSLTFQDGLFDRWERAKRLGFGEGSNIYNSSCVYGDVKVGKHVWIGPFTLLDGMGGGLTIGDHCAISTGAQIYTHDTVLRSLSGGQLPMHKAPVKIGNCCHIAPNVIIAAGVILGNRTLVAANSFVNKTFAEDNLILGGNPAKIIGHVVVSADNKIELRYDRR